MDRTVISSISLNAGTSRKLGSARMVTIVNLLTLPELMQTQLDQMNVPNHKLNLKHLLLDLKINLKPNQKQKPKEAVQGLP